MRRVSRRELRSAFAESCGVAVDALQKLDEGKGTFLFFIGTKAGAAATELLPSIVQAVTGRASNSTTHALGIRHG